MSNSKKVEYLDIFETQRSIQFVWDHYADKFLSETDDDGIEDGQFGCDYKHNEADIHVWSKDWDTKLRSGMEIVGTGFEISAVSGNDDHTKALHINYWGDRQAMSQWLLDWKLQM